MSAEDRMQALLDWLEDLEMEILTLSTEIRNLRYSLDEDISKGV